MHPARRGFRVPGHPAHGLNLRNTDPMKPTLDLNSTVSRHFLIKCKTNRGGRYLVPVSIQEIHLTPEDSVTDYTLVGKPSPYFGATRDPLTKRGDLVTLTAGDRITRTPHVGKTVRTGRNGFTFVQVTVSVPEWVQFTKRTGDPKLQWLKDTCEAEGLRVVEQGASWHAPITYVHRDDHDAAWKILGPVDNVRDDASRFRKHVKSSGAFTF